MRLHLHKWRVFMRANDVRADSHVSKTWTVTVCEECVRCGETRYRRANASAAEVEQHERTVNPNVWPVAEVK